MKETSISRTEWKVMQVLWKCPAITVSDVVEALSDTGWSYSTIKTLLKRLTDKGYVEVDKKSGNNFRYMAAVREEDCKRREATSFFIKVFDGSLSMFVSTFAQDSDLTDKERDELLAMIERMEER